MTGAYAIAYAAGLRAAHAAGYEMASQSGRMRVVIAAEAVRVLRAGPEGSDLVIAACDSRAATPSLGIARNETKRNK